MSKLVPSRRNPRRVKPERDAHRRMVASIRAHGLLAPLVVRADENTSGGFKVIAGNRRLAALRDVYKESAKPPKVPCVLRSVDDDTADALALAENFVREPMHPLDEAEAFAQLAREEAKGVEAIAAEFGVSQARYGRVRDNETYRDLEIGSVAELGAGTHRRQQVTAQIAAVAKVNGGVYSAQLHESYLRVSQMDSTDREIESAVRSAAFRLDFVAGFEGSGVRAARHGEYAVDADAFVQFGQRGSHRTDVRVIAEHSLASQIDAHAVTWLDRQAFGDRPDARMANHPAALDAVQQRREWLVQNGYAERPDGDGGSVRPLPEALQKLAFEERSRLEEQLEKRYDRPVVELPKGGTVEGEYHGTEHLHAGKLAVVVTEESVFVSPTTKTPDVAAGSEVSLERTAAQDATVKLAAGQSIDLDAGLSLGGPGVEI
jgi:ParB/RepB/Spo0J family partition protein